MIGAERRTHSYLDKNLELKIFFEAAESFKAFMIKVRSQIQLNV